MKRIVCVLLTLIMLLSLVPVGASAASYSTSAAAITVLKQMTKFESECYHFTGSEFRIGYGTVCEEEHSFSLIGQPAFNQEKHTITEAKADAALREALKELDKKVNSFASSNGKSLSQSQHDALVVFSYNAGADWMNGNGVVKTAILNNADGNELLNAMNLWTNNADINRRKVEVNMYMNGVYSTTVPTSYVAITYKAMDGHIAQGDGSTYVMYYDATSNQKHIPVATHATKRFLGWYSEGGAWVPVIHSGLNGATMEAKYVTPGTEVAANYTMDATYISPKAVYDNTLEKLATSEAQKKIAGVKTVTVKGEKMDANGNHWCKLDNNAWVKVGTAGTGYVASAQIIGTVTVTNSYVNRRVNATASSAKNGSYSQGDVLNVIQEDGGWLQIGVVKDDGTVEAVGWVSAIYTNWGSSQENASGAQSTNVIGTAVVTFNGYLNIRQEPGTDAKIVGALAKNDTVELYEVKTVNGHQWGRIKSGWICLTYTSISYIENAIISDEGLKLYSFTGSVKNADMTEVRVAAGAHNNIAQYKDGDGKLQNLFIKKGKAVTINNLVVVDGETWAKATWKNDEWKWKDSTKKEKVDVTNTRSGWVKLPGVTATYAVGSEIELDPVKYNVSAETVNVRDGAGDANNWIFSLNKGTQVEVNQILLVGENIWGKITVKNVDVKGKTGVESDTFGTSTGWINLSTKYVSRNDVPTLETENHNTGKIATVINTDSLRVRATGATYGAQIGSLSRGTTVSVWESNEDGWYKVDSNQNGSYEYDGDGWVSGAYLDIREGTAGGNSTVTDAAGNKYETNGTGKGVVANTYSGVNVRTGPSTAYASKGKLLPGTMVDILELSGNTKWGRTAQGWVSMDYITMVTYNEVVNTPAGGTSVGSYDEAQKTTTTAVYTGVLDSGVKVYRTPEIKDSEVIRTTAQEENVTIYELAAVTKNVTSDEIDVEDDSKTVTTTITTTTYWARINDGWVQNPETTISLNALDEKVHTQTGVEKLNVRRSPDETADNVFDVLVQGDQVNVTALEIVRDKVWGRIETDEGTGWIRLDYMSEGAIYVQAPVQNTIPTVTQPTLGAGSSTGGFVNNTSGYRYTGNVIRTNEVNVRATPSTTASKTTTLKNGQALVIYETTTSEGMAWGRCDAGWVYLYYVDLVPATGAVDARVVANDNTIAYTDMNCSAVAGTYARQSVIDIFEIVGKMARTELGWVNVDNLL